MVSILTNDQVLELRSKHGWAKETIRAIEAQVLAALAQQPPVAYLRARSAMDPCHAWEPTHSHDPNGMPVYAAPKAAAPAKLEPMSLEDSAEVARVCCGEYASCYRPCTPRGRWQAQQDAAAPADLTDDQLIAVWESLPNRLIRKTDAVPFGRAVLAAYRKTP